MPGTTTSSKVLASFLTGQARLIRNDACGLTYSGIGQLKLHGNVIAQRFPNGVIYATLAGWPTVTTRDRLNALCNAINLRRGFSQASHLQYYGGREITPNDSILLRADDERIARHRKGLRLPKAYEFECDSLLKKWNIRLDEQWAGGWFETEAEARAYAKDRLAEERAIAELTVQKELAA